MAENLISLAPEVMTRSWLTASGENKTILAGSREDEVEPGGGGGAMGVMSSRSTCISIKGFNVYMYVHVNTHYF